MEVDRHQLFTILSTAKPGRYQVNNVNPDANEFENMLLHTMGAVVDDRERTLNKLMEEKYNTNYS